MRLTDQVALITGAGAGIGAATACLFTAEGARVAVADINLAHAQAVAQRINDSGGDALALAVDVSNAAQCADMVAAVLAHFGRLDVLVNNAGFGTTGTVETTPDDVLDRILDVNVKSIFYCSRPAIAAMRAQGGGVIVNTASNIASIGLPDRAAYVASKGAVAALTRSMALDHIKDGIRVNCVAPGVIASSYFDRILPTVPDPDAFLKALNARQPMGRTGTPQEIAYAILYLACQESSFATGTMLTVDGGATAA